MEILVILFIVFCLIVGYFAFSRLNNRLDMIQKGKDEAENTMIVGLNQRVDSLSKNVADSLQKVTDTVLHQLNENTKQVDTRLQSNNQTWQQSSQDIRKTIDSNIKTIGGVTEKLAQMEEAHKRIYEVGKDIASLQEILRAPKLRGTLGELFLGDLLSQVFPKDRYELQHTFKSGETVDAILILRDEHTISIDSKFPLESFKRIIEAKDETEKKIAKKQFRDSFKKRIDEIAGKYIVPDEGTLDFALMYVPAENVYYETIIKGEGDLDVIQYAYSKRVIPVSPNNLYVYLQTIALGLRGMQVEERAKEILADLTRLNTEFIKVADSYDILGKHLSNAVAKYEDTSRLIGKFGTRVEQIEAKTGNEKKVLEPPHKTEVIVAQ